MINGINERGAAALASLKQASARAAVHECKMFVVLGDLFDHTRPTPQLVAGTAAALLEGKLYRPGMRIIVILGNHDAQSDGEGDHACASLALIDGIEVIAHPSLICVGDVELLCAPYLPGLASEWLPNSMVVHGKATTRIRLLATHIGIWDEDTPAFMKAARDAVGIGQLRFWMDAADVHMTFAGNWHAFKRFDSDRPIESREPARTPVLTSAVIPGTLVPAGFQEPDQHLVGRMIMWDSNDPNAITTHTIEGPRFHTLTLGTSLNPARWSSVPPTPTTQRPTSPPAGHAGDRLATLTTDSRSRLYVRIRCQPDQLVEATAMRDNYLERECVAFVEVIEDDTLVRDAAQAAVAASQGEGPVADYVGLVEVAPPGTREGVAARLVAYRKAAL